MEELIQRLEKIGLSPEQARASLVTIKDYIVEKFPMVGGMVDNMFGEAEKGKTDDDSVTGKLGGMFGK